MTAPDARVPVSLLTGFLGAGKTTLLNRILHGDHGERIAVLINEFGDVPIDGRLVVSADEEVIELANGCVCCTVRGDLVRALGGLLERRARRFRNQPFDRLVIETSGLASPGPVLQTLLIEPQLAECTRAAGVVSLANAGHIIEELREHPECREQIGYADLVLLNHADRVSQPELVAAEAAIRAHNALAPIERSVRSEIDPARIFSLEHRPPLASELAEAHGHGQAGTVVLRSTKPLALPNLKIWLQFLSNKRSHSLWRLKGLIHCVERPEAVLVQGVYQYLEIGPGEESAPEESLLVLIGQDFDEAEIQRGWAACIANS